MFKKHFGLVQFVRKGHTVLKLGERVEHKTEQEHVIIWNESEIRTDKQMLL